MGLVAYRLREASCGRVRCWLRFGAVLLAGALATPSSLFAQVQVNQTFISQGPATSSGPIDTIQSGDNPPNGTVSGAIGPIVTDPGNANVIYVGTPNGGIWKTSNGGTTWTALTANQASLSISALSLDPTDTTHQTLIAGEGLTANGGVCSVNAACSLTGSGGILNGLLYSTNGGATWTQLGTTTFANRSVSGVVAVGQDILASTSLTSGLGSDTRSGALYRSTNGGTTFTQVSGAAGTGLPAGPVTSLVTDPTNPNRIYAAVSSTSGATNASSAVYASSDGGATWSPVFYASKSNGTIQSATQTYLKIATGPGGSVAVGVINIVPTINGDHDNVTGLFWSGNSGTTWTTLQVPALSPAHQGIPNFAIAIDPSNRNLVYVSGDETAAGNPFTVSAFRIDATTTDATSITDANTSNGSTAHADSRSIAFTASGTLLLSSDGAIYARSNPGSDNGSWTGISGNISAFEIYHIAYDSVGKRIAVAAQDTGVAVQSAPNSPSYNAREGADGVNVLVNDVTLAAQGYSVIYSSIDSISLPIRMIVDQQGNIVSHNNTNPNLTFGFGIPVTCDHTDCFSDVSGAYFSSPWVTNNVDPTRMAIGGDHVYVTQDTSLTTLTVTQLKSATSVNLTLTDLGAAGNAVLTIAYGTRDNPNMLVAGGDGTDKLYQSTTATANSIAPVTSYVPAGGRDPTSIMLDPRSQYRYFVADNNNLFGTIDQGNSFTKLTVNLAPLNIVEPTSLSFISANGVNALVVGGVNNVANAQSTIAVADSDTNGGLTNWRSFGTGLPNTLVSALSYNATADVLAVGTFGSGAYALYDVTSYFPQAIRLQFGLADNDSMPDASYLTNGIYSSRSLIKYGAGTLTIAGDATYTGGTSIYGGALVLGTGGASGSVIGNITFCSDATVSGCDALTDKFLVFNRSDVFTFGGAISGPGQVVQEGPGTTVLSGVNTYTGPTTVMAGTLSVTGSITSSVFVDSGAMLSGSGTVGSVTINDGGVLAPANPGGALTVRGNLVFSTAGAYLVQIADNGADRVNVTGSATLAGNVFVVLTGSTISKQYTILNATGGVTGTFAGVNNLPSTIAGNLSYDPNNVFLNLSLNYNALGALNSNQQNVANALSSFFNSSGRIPVTYATLTQAALSQIAGETATGSQQTTFQAMTQFITTLLDPFIDGRESVPSSSPASAYTAENTSASAYADTRKSWSERERAAYNAVFTKAPLRQVYDPHWSVWAAAFGGSQTTDGNAATGSNSATSRIFGMAAGADYLLSPRTIAGFGLSGGGTNFSVANAGTGRSDLFQAGAYVRHTAGNAYVSAALAYGWQDVTTDRMAVSDKLHAEFDANALSGRVEGGYRFATKWMGITPYAAGQFTTFFLPNYAESVVFGSGAFALAYGAQSVTDARTEVGFRTDRSFALATGLLTLRSRFAWAHDYDPNRTIASTFQALPGASFVVGGAAQASESVLTTLSAEMKWRNGWAAAATFEGEFSQVTASYAGKGVVRYVW